MFLSASISTFGQISDELLSKLRKNNDILHLTLGIEQIAKAKSFHKNEYEFLDLLVQNIKSDVSRRTLLQNIPNKENANFDLALTKLLPSLSKCRNINYYFYDIIKLMKERDSKIVTNSLKSAFTSTSEFEREDDYIFYKYEILKTIFELQGISSFEFIVSHILEDTSGFNDFEMYSKLSNVMIEYLNEPRNTFNGFKEQLDYQLHFAMNIITNANLTEKVNKSKNHKKFFNQILKLSNLKLDSRSFNSTINIDSINKVLSIMYPIESEFNSDAFDEHISREILRDIIKMSVDTVDDKILSQIEFLPNNNKSVITKKLDNYLNKTSKIDNIYLSEYLLDRHFEYLSILNFAACSNNIKLNKNARFSLDSLFLKLSQLANPTIQSSVSRKSFRGENELNKDVITLFKTGRYKISVEHREYNFQQNKYYELIRIDKYDGSFEKIKYTSDIPLKYLRLLKKDYKVFDYLDYSLMEYELLSMFGTSPERIPKWERISIDSTFILKLASEEIINCLQIANQTYFTSLNNVNIHSDFTLSNFTNKTDSFDELSQLVSVIKSSDSQHSNRLIKILEQGSGIIKDSLIYNQLKTTYRLCQTEALNSETRKSYFTTVKNKFNGLCDPRENKWYEIYRIEPSNIEDKKNFKANWLKQSRDTIANLNNEINETAHFNYFGITKVNSITPINLFFNNDTTEVFGYYKLETNRGKKIIQYESKIDSNFTLIDDILTMLDENPNVIYQAGLDIFQASENSLNNLNNSINFLKDLRLNNYYYKSLFKNGYKSKVHISKIKLKEILTLYNFNYGINVFEEISFLKGKENTKTDFENNPIPNSETINFVNSFNHESRSIISSNVTKPKNTFLQNFERDTKDWCSSGFFIGITLSSDASFQNMQVTGFNFRPTDFQGLAVNIGINTIYNKYLRP